MVEKLLILIVEIDYTELRIADLKEHVDHFPSQAVQGGGLYQQCRQLGAPLLYFYL